MYRRKWSFGKKKMTMEINVVNMFIKVMTILNVEEEFGYIKLLSAKMLNKEAVSDKTKAPIARIWIGNNFFNGLTLLIILLWTKYW